MVYCAVCKTYLGFKPTGGPELPDCPKGCTIPCVMVLEAGIIRDLKA
jgi:hypothetical protein